ncbi:Hint domain-containing protein [Jannaschia sp. M317]|uniref:Hint domain-containing protein n=1 Tax=Jannaschia sp. M317 TaxID=2867011 RepID=UPI0021A78D0D|nr:Hint domain-containing protein [Jannaschia sp. M317]UWQ19012.1 Hint domain-containing protein [Jannaschia sp. M317]
MTQTPLSALSRCTVFPAEALSVDTGALMGDPIGDLTQVVAGDVYALDPKAQARELVLTRAAGTVTVAAGSSVGVTGQPVVPLARHQLMGDRGTAAEVLVLDLGGVRMALPLGALSPADEYTLISSEAVAGELGSVASVSFARGTKITGAGGHQIPVENLREGDRVLTRDHGPQAVRWTGQQTVRAEGANAPVVIEAGALNNADDLILSPDHRLFIYQRRDAIGAGRAEVLVRARHLVNGTTIRRANGGHVDYFHLLFDAHEIIYAEGIPAESLLVSPDVLAGLDEDLARDVQGRMQGRNHAPHHGIEPSASDLDGLDAADLLRRASSR